MGCCACKEGNRFRKSYGNLHEDEGIIIESLVTFESAHLQDGKIFASTNASINNTGSHYAVAIFAYQPRTDADLKLREGDIIKILDNLSNRESDGWIRVEAVSRHEVGFIPASYIATKDSLESQPWFFGILTRMGAKLKLQEKKNEIGSFLIRKSEKTEEAYYSLAILAGDGIKHFKIESRTKGWRFTKRRRYFKNLPEMVKYHSQSTSLLGLKLEKPCFNKNPPVTKDLDFSTKDKWEIDRSSLTFIKELGQGQFGIVWEATWNGTPIAIKTCKNLKTNRSDLLQEAKIMRKLHHPNLVQLYGVCTEKEPILLITELMVKGCLRETLKTKPLSFSLLIYIAIQVSKGMDYLEANNFVHRDLAARNILLGKNYITKVGDFGLTKVLGHSTIYKPSGHAAFALKWASPEVIRSLSFSVKSDVWSFGILLFEMVTKGESPYHGLSNSEVRELLTKEKYRLPRPKSCPVDMYKLMLKCWTEEPDKRPNFSKIRNKLEVIEKDFQKKV